MGASKKTERLFGPAFSWLITFSDRNFRLVAYPWSTFVVIGDRDVTLIKMQLKKLQYCSVFRVLVWWRVEHGFSTISIWKILPVFVVRMIMSLVQHILLHSMSSVRANRRRYRWVPLFNQIPQVPHHTRHKIPYTSYYNQDIIRITHPLGRISGRVSYRTLGTLTTKMVVLETFRRESFIGCYYIARRIQYALLPVVDKPSFWKSLEEVCYLITRVIRYCDGVVLNSRIVWYCDNNGVIVW